MRDLKSDILVTAPNTVITDRVGGYTSGAIDLQGFNALAITFAVGTITTTGSLTIKLQESDDNVTYTDVGAEHLDGELVAFATNTNQSIGYVGVSRYVKIVSVEDAVTVAEFDPIIVKGFPSQAPVA